MATNRPIGNYYKTGGAYRGPFIIGKPKFKVPKCLRLDHDLNSTILARQMQYDLGRVNRSLEISNEQEIRLRDAMEKETMAQEVKQLKRAEFVDRKRRQQLREDCEELRQLAEHIRLAAISKQIAEDLEYRKHRRQLAVKAEAQEAAEERCLLEAKEREREAALREEQRRLREFLNNQMEENRVRRQQEHAQVMNDRDLIQARQKQINDEDRAQQLEMEQQKLRKRHDMLQSIQENREAREWERTQNRLELNQLLQKQSEIDDIKQRLEEEKLKVQRKKQEISIRLGQQNLEIEKQKRHRDNILQDLLEAEHSAKGDERFRQQLLQENMSRRRTRQELDRYRLEVERRKMEQMQQKRAELELQQEDFFEKNQQDDRERQLEDYRRRRAHGSTLLAMIEENQRKRAEATAENVQYFDLKAKNDAELQERVKRERLLMLGQVPAAVLRYLPKNALTSADRDHFVMLRDEKMMGGGDA
ncbi:hypothetical protein KR009_006261 [Drosophila setifemur]|nr:hypothetical protein KR009_006261 [Drosophila setifemur]